MNYVCLFYKMTYASNRLQEVYDNRFEESEIWHFFNIPMLMDRRDTVRFLG